MAPTQEECDAAAPLSLAVGSALLAGTVLAYAPQLVRLRRRRTERGLSFDTLMLNMAATWLTLATLLRGAAMWVACVEHFDATGAISAALPPALSIADLVCQFVVVSQWLHLRRSSRRIGIALVNFAIGAVVCAAATLLSLLDTGAVFFGAAGVLAAVMVGVTWAPQLVETWRVRELGALSPTMLLVKIPGALAVVVYFAFLSEPRVEWYSWLPYIMSALMMGGALVVHAVRAEAGPALPTHTLPAVPAEIAADPGASAFMLSNDDDGVVDEDGEEMMYDQAASSLTPTKND